MITRRDVLKATAAFPLLPLLGNQAEASEATPIDSFAQFCEEHIKIKIPTQDEPIPLVLNEHQEFGFHRLQDDDFPTDRQIARPRQTGYSTLFCAYALWNLLERPTYEKNEHSMSIVSDDPKAICKIMQTMVSNLPVNIQSRLDTFSAVCFCKLSVAQQYVLVLDWQYLKNADGDWKNTKMIFDDISGIREKDIKRITTGSSLNVRNFSI